ncbi:Multidrug resistance-associated protein ABC Superfamily, partial [Phytophthora palmivora]
MDSTHYIEVPPTPHTGSQGDNSRPKKLRLAERYAQEEPFRNRANPLQHASLASVLSAYWLQPLVSLGAQKILEKEDIWAVTPQDSCDVLYERFRHNYTPDKQELLNLPHVAMGFFKTFRRQIATIIANYCVYMTAMVLQPFIAKAILQFLEDEDNVFNINNGYVLVVLMVGVSFVGITCLNYGFFLSSRVGANMRAIAMDIVYRKALNLSCIARQAYTTGEITTLMSVDSERIFFAIINGPWILVAPLS